MQPLIQGFCNNNSLKVKYLRILFGGTGGNKKILKVWKIDNGK